MRVWHPGQAWILEPGGLGVFDPGINALSILTRILPQPLFVTAADLAFPANRDAPIAAQPCAQRCRRGCRSQPNSTSSRPARRAGTSIVDTDGGPVTLSMGGARLAGRGQAAGRCRGRRISPGSIAASANSPRPASTDVDLAPLQLVADAFLLGRRRIVEPFEDVT